MYCRSCGTKQTEKTLFCSHCDMLLEIEKNYCFECGAKTTKEQKECLLCGESFDPRKRMQKAIKQLQEEMNNE